MKCDKCNIKMELITKEKYTTLKGYKTEKALYICGECDRRQYYIKLLELDKRKIFGEYNPTQQILLIDKELEPKDGYCRHCELNEELYKKENSKNLLQEFL